MYKSIREYLKRPMDGKILGISGIDNFYPMIHEKAHIVEANFPDVDMQDLPYGNNTFNFVISDQVIEHLENPKKAIDESYRILRTGGIAIHTTCFMNAIHPCPKDFFRFSPDSLKYLCKNFSEILRCEGWGNRLAILLCFLGNRLRLMRIPKNKSSLRHVIATWNEKGYPIVTWIIAKK